MTNTLELGKGHLPEYGAWVRENFEGAIIDSGLFSVMFGTEERLGVQIKSYADCVRWARNYLARLEEVGWRGFWVEVDAQKVIGADMTWMLRRDTVDKDPSRAIVVWHVEDGDEGLTRMVERYPYISLGCVELTRLYGPHRLIPALDDRMRFIRNTARRLGVPMPRVHMLGASNPKIIEPMARTGAYSSDSTSWLSATKYGKCMFWEGGRFVAYARRSREFAAYRDRFRATTDPALLTGLSDSAIDRAVVAREFARFQDYLDSRYSWRDIP